MEIAAKALTVGGMFVLSFGFVLGIPMSVTRGRAPRAPRYLFAAHLAAIVQGGVLLAMTVAIGLSTLPPDIETLAAFLLISGIVLFDLGLVVNWLQGVEDAFAERSVGSKISTIGAPLVLLGAGIILYGVVTAL